MEKIKSDLYFEKTLSISKIDLFFAKKYRSDLYFAKTLSNRKTMKI